MKKCSKCKKRKLEKSFYKHCLPKTGLLSICKTCHNRKSRLNYRKNKLRYRIRHREWTKNHPEETLGYKRKYRWGITTAQYQLIFDSQGGKCAICQRKLSKPHLDHCHKTKIIRGILCQQCNHALGLFKDSPDTCREAANYLENAVNKNQITESIT